MLTNLPKWATTQSFAISARIPGNPTKDQVRAMMKTLLAERFHLALHFEQQDRAVFALTLMKQGEPGPGLYKTTSCKIEGTRPASSGPITDLRWLPCNIYFRSDRPGGAVIVAARNTTMSQLCAFLSSAGDFRRMVVDKSGLTSPIDFSIEYTKAGMTAGEDPSPNPSEPLQSALTTQLGLKLSPIKALVSVPTIDKLDPLTDN